MGACDRSWKTSQMCDFAQGSLSYRSNPDRLNALVWQPTEVVLNRDLGPRIKSLF
jgi:phage terminase large subunit-like protein